MKPLPLVYVMAVLLTCRAVDYETDQYLNRLQPVEDSIELMDDYVNRRINREAMWRVSVESFD